MANTLSNLIPDCYAALDVVSRELVGFIPSVARDPSADRVALNQTLRSPATAANTGGLDITPAMSLPSASNQTVSNKSLTITKTRAFPFSWTGEEQYSMDAGPGFLTIKQDQIAQALRAACNEIETDISVAASIAASRAYGAAGTVPFATTLAGTAQVRKILDDNGAPASDRHLVINTIAGANLRNLTQLTKVNEAGDASMLRQGVILNVHNFDIKESAQIQIPAVGTAASATVSNAGYAVGATTLTLTAAGTGTLVAGDIITIARETDDDGSTLHKFVVVTGIADVSAGGTIVIAAPGLRKALTASTAAITVIAATARNCAFSRNAIVLGTRLPIVPEGGDLATDRQTITDPRSGLSFEIAMYPGFRMNVYHVSICWGVTVFKPEHLAFMLG